MKENLLIKIRGNCVSALTFTPNCDFTLIFVDFAFLPLLFRNEVSFYPYSVKAPHSVKEDNFALANIPLLFFKLCEYTLICHYIAATFQ